jgi:hypothetical protein
MKTKLFILLAVCYLIANTLVKAQAYIPFAKNGKMWTEYWYEGDLPYHGINSFIMQGDTIINSKTYKKVNGNSYYEYNFVRYIFEDTLNKKVYYYDFTHQKDSLIYDFNLQVGDTFISMIMWYPMGYDTCKSIVTGIDTEYFAGTNRLKINLGYLNRFDGTIMGIYTWYEGIGCLLGVFNNSYSYFLTGGYYSEMLCYFEDSTLLYHDSNVLDTCFGSTQIKELQPEKLINSHFSNNILYINPAKPTYYTLSVYDLFGRIIKETTATGNIEVNLSALQHGLYIYKIESSDMHYYYYIGKLVLNQ